jgi:hypothetical protein
MQVEAIRVDSVRRLIFRWLVTVTFSTLSIPALALVGALSDHPEAWRFPLRDGTILLLAVTFVVVPYSALLADARSGPPRAQAQLTEFLLVCGFVIGLSAVLTYGVLWENVLTRDEYDADLIQLLSSIIGAAGTAFGFACEALRRRIRLLWIIA